MKTEILLVLFSGAAAALLCALLIPLLKRLRAGQYILGYVKEHASKGGTPTMGGIAFVAAAAAAAAAFGLLADRHTLVALTFGLAYAAVGFLDDLLKLRGRHNLGLHAWQKIVFQMVVALFAGLYCWKSELTLFRIPFSAVTFDAGIWTVPLVAFAFVATTNCVNLTDGLDGLAASVGFWYFAAFAALILLFSGTGSPLSGLCFALCGALAGYLLFNTNRASVFMGDTGSLGMGGFAASVAAFSGNLLFLPVVGIMFVCSGISVILQVIYYKRTKKRIFLMAPLHHHLQEKGYAEGKIAYVYSFITAAAGLCCLFFAI